MHTITRPAPLHLTCHQCGYEWDSRLKGGQFPKKCPFCQSWYWDVPRDNGVRQTQKGK